MAAEGHNVGLGRRGVSDGSLQPSSVRGGRSRSHTFASRLASGSEAGGSVAFRRGGSHDRSMAGILATSQGSNDTDKHAPGAYSRRRDAGRVADLHDWEWSIENRLFSVLHVMTEVHKSGNFMKLGRYALMFLGWLQLVALVVHEEHGWEQSIAIWVQSGAVAQWLLPEKGSPSVFVAGCSTMLVIVWLSLIDGVYVSFSLRNSNWRVWPIKVLRFAVTTLLTAGYLPVLQVLFVPFRCSLLERYKVSCDAPVATGFAVAAGVTLTIFVPLSLMFALVHHADDPLSGVPTARPTGRADLVDTILRIVAVVFTRFVDDKTVVVAVLITCALLMMITRVMLLPYFLMKLNFIRCASGAVIVWLSVCSAVLLSLDKDANKVVYNAAFLGCSTVAAMIGALIGRARYSWLLDKAMLIRRDGAALAASRDTTAVAVHGASASAARVSPKRPDFVSALPTVPAGEPRRDSSERSLTLRQAQQKYLLFEMDVDTMARVVIDEGAPGALDRAAIIYSEALHCFPDSSYLHLAYCRFLQVYKKDTFRSLALLQETRKLRSFIDTRFMLFSKTRKHSQLRQSQTLGGQALDMVGVVEFLGTFSRVQKHHSRAIRNLRDFWETMVTMHATELTGDPEALDTDGIAAALASILRACHHHMAIADSGYRAMLPRYPRSTVLRQSYGMFLLNAMQNVDTARAYLPKLQDPIFVPIEGMFGAAATFEQRRRAVFLQRRYRGRHWDVEESALNVRRQSVTRSMWLTLLLAVVAVSAFIVVGQLKGAITASARHAHVASKGALDAEDIAVLSRQMWLTQAETELRTSALSAARRLDDIATTLHEDRGTSEAVRGVWASDVADFALFHSSGESEVIELATTMSVWDMLIAFVTAGIEVASDSSEVSNLLDSHHARTVLKNVLGKVVPVFVGLQQTYVEESCAASDSIDIVGWVHMVAIIGICIALGVLVYSPALEHILTTRRGLADVVFMIPDRDAKRLRDYYDDVLRSMDESQEPTGTADISAQESPMRFNVSSLVKSGSVNPTGTPVMSRSDGSRDRLVADAGRAVLRSVGSRDTEKSHPPMLAVMPKRALEMSTRRVHSPPGSSHSLSIAPPSPASIGVVEAESTRSSTRRLRSSPLPPGDEGGSAANQSVREIPVVSQRAGLSMQPTSGARKGSARSVTTAGSDGSAADRVTIAVPQDTWRNLEELIGLEEPHQADVQASTGPAGDMGGSAATFRSGGDPEERELADDTVHQFQQETDRILARVRSMVRHASRRGMVPGKPRSKLRGSSMSDGDVERSAPKPSADLKRHSVASVGRGVAVKLSRRHELPRRVLTEPDLISKARADTSDDLSEATGVTEETNSTHGTRRGRGSLAPLHTKSAPVMSEHGTPVESLTGAGGLVTSGAVVYRPTLKPRDVQPAGRSSTVSDDLGSVVAEQDLEGHLRLREAGASNKAEGPLYAGSKSPANLSDPSINTSKTSNESGSTRRGFGSSGEMLAQGLPGQGGPESVPSSKLPGSPHEETAQQPAWLGSSGHTKSSGSGELNAVACKCRCSCATNRCASVHGGVSVRKPSVATSMRDRRRSTQTLPRFDLRATMSPLSDSDERVGLDDSNDGLAAKRGRQARWRRLSTIFRVIVLLLFLPVLHSVVIALSRADSDGVCNSVSELSASGASTRRRSPHAGIAAS